MRGPNDHGLVAVMLAAMLTVYVLLCIALARTA